MEELPDVYHFVIEGCSYARGLGKTPQDIRFYERKLTEHEGKEITKEQFIEAYLRYLAMKTEINQIIKQMEIYGKNT